MNRKTLIRQLTSACCRPGTRCARVRLLRLHVVRKRGIDWTVDTAGECGSWVALDVFGSVFGQVAPWGDETASHGSVLLEANRDLRTVLAGQTGRGCEWSERRLKTEREPIQS